MTPSSKDRLPQSRATVLQEASIATGTRDKVNPYENIKQYLGTYYPNTRLQACMVVPGLLVTDNTNTVCVWRVGDHYHATHRHSGPKIDSTMCAWSLPAEFDSLHTPSFMVAVAHANLLCLEYDRVLALPPGFKTIMTVEV